MPVSLVLCCFAKKYQVNSFGNSPRLCTFLLESISTPSRKFFIIQHYLQRKAVCFLTDICISFQGCISCSKHALFCIAFYEVPCCISPAFFFYIFIDWTRNYCLRQKAFQELMFLRHFSQGFEGCLRFLERNHLSSAKWWSE